MVTGFALLFFILGLSFKGRVSALKLGAGVLDVPLDDFVRAIINEQAKELARYNVTLGDLTHWVGKERAERDTPPGVSPQLWIAGLRGQELIDRALQQRCRAPQPGEKVIYFIRHAHKSTVTHANLDPLLTEEGTAQARALKEDETLASGAFSQERPSQRAEYVVASPMRRTLQTALLGFAERGTVTRTLKWGLDVNLREVCSVGSPTEGAQLLQHEGSVAEGLLQEYENLPAGWERDPCGSGHWPGVDVHAVIKHLLDVPYNHIIAVSHELTLQMAVGAFFKEGEVRAYALSPSGELAKLSASHECWPPV